MRADHLAKVKATIESCLTYEQVQACLSFLENRYLCRTDSDRIQVGSLIRDKLHEMRMADLKHHNEEMERIIKKYT